MRITVLNTYDRLWGASIASMRICEALIEAGAEVRFLVLRAITPKPYMDVIENGKIDLFWSQLVLFKEKGLLALADRPEKRGGNKRFNFSFSVSDSGRRVEKRTSVTGAEVLHLNWTNNAFLSFDSLRQLARTGKPLVWTLHDQWAFTGGCHYSADCEGYLKSCGNCPFLKKPRPDDLSNRIFLQKKALYASGNFHFTAPSRWMAGLGSESSLLKPYGVKHLFLPINTEVFRPNDQLQARKELNLPPDKKLILFGSAKLTDERKGFPYLEKALLRLKDLPESIRPELVVYGFADKEPVSPAAPIHYLGMLKTDEELARCYSACDLMALPTSMDNLPLTVLEALACGLPVTAFNVGGLGDLVENDFNGFLVPFGDDSGLADAIKRILEASSEGISAFRENARTYAQTHFSYPVLGKKYLEFYAQIVENGRR